MGHKGAPALHRDRTTALLAYMRPIAANMRLVAMQFTYNGLETLANQLLIERSRVVEQRLGTILLFTRDTEMHSSGWLKSPDYERCWHLSLSFRDPATGHPREFDWPLARLWALAFFNDALRLAWVESPKTERGRVLGVQHWRVFADAHWEPILPRGEVYNTQFTELGWKSASEVRATTGRIIESVVDPT